MIVNPGPALLIEERVQIGENVIHFLAEKLLAFCLDGLPAQRSHDFH